MAVVCFIQPSPCFIDTTSHQNNIAINQHRKRRKMRARKQADCSCTPVQSIILPSYMTLHSGDLVLSFPSSRVPIDWTFTDVDPVPTQFCLPIMLGNPKSIDYPSVIFAPPRSSTFMTSCRAPIPPSVTIYLIHVSL